MRETRLARALPLGRAEPLVGAGAAPSGELAWNAARPPAKISDSGSDEPSGRLTVFMRCKPGLHLPTGHHRGSRVIMKRALLVIDVQNEYFPGGQLPITHPHSHLDNILRVMDSATEAGLPVVVVQHTFTQPEVPFFKRGTPGWSCTRRWPRLRETTGSRRTSPAASPARTWRSGCASGGSIA